MGTKNWTKIIKLELKIVLYLINNPSFPLFPFKKLEANWVGNKRLKNWTRTLKCYLKLFILINNIKLKNHNLLSI